jgi:hypothetical protein
MILLITDLTVIFYADTWSVKRKIRKVDFDYISEKLSLTDKHAAGAFRRMSRHKPKAMQWIKKYFLSDDLKVAYSQVIEQPYKQFGI